jgi:ADP-heptose:LPS heptosyltransferase
VRIIVGLLEHMGDIVACEPVARYLKFNHPKAHLAWAVRLEFRELIDTNPFIENASRIAP